MKNKSLETYAIIITVIAAMLLVAVALLGISVGRSKPQKDPADAVASEVQPAPESGTVSEETASEETTAGFELEYQADNAIYNVGGIVGWESGNNDSLNIIHAWENMLKQLNLDTDIVFFGDSIFERGNLGALFPDRRVVNLGCGGDTIRGVYNRAKMLSYVHAEKIFVMCGVNMLRDDNVDFCTTEYSGLLNAISEYAPDTRIYVCSILPMAQAWQDQYCRHETTELFNGKIKELAEKRQMTYVDLYPLYEKDGVIAPEYTIDGVHLTEAGYDLFAQTISQYINE